MPQENTRFLLNHVTIDTVGNPIRADGASKALDIWGAFGGGQVSIQRSPDGGITWIPLTYEGVDAVFTENSARGIMFNHRGTLLRAVLAGSSGSVDVSVTIS